VCQPIARALRDLLARYRDPHLQRPTIRTIKTKKTIRHNSIMGQCYESRRIFLPAGPLLKIWPYPSKTLCSGPGSRPGRHDNGGTGLAPRHHVRDLPCAVPMKLSRIGQHIKDEPCAKQRALLDVFSSRYSSVSRGHQIWCSLFS
jgi:hypothetical protein